MFTQIKTSKKSKEIISNLTRKLGLGTENNIARIALAISLSNDHKLNLNDISDSGGKEYSKSVLFGDYTDYYIGLICIHYNIYSTDKDIPKYIKLHIDKGLETLDHEISNKSNIDGFDYLVTKIKHSLN